MARVALFAWVALKVGEPPQSWLPKTTMVSNWVDFSGDSQGQLLNILWLDLVHQPCAIHDPSYEANKMFAHRNNISHISSTSQNTPRFQHHCHVVQEIPR